MAGVQDLVFITFLIWEIVGWAGETGRGDPTYKLSKKGMVGGEGQTLKRLYFLYWREPEGIHFPQDECNRRVKVVVMRELKLGGYMEVRGQSWFLVCFMGSMYWTEVVRHGDSVFTHWAILLAPVWLGDRGGRGGERRGGGGEETESQVKDKAWFYICKVFTRQAFV